jgi:hypothetical protein
MGSNFEVQLQARADACKNMLTALRLLTRENTEKGHKETP